MSELKQECLPLPINQVICGDSLQLLKTYASQSADMLFTSPPYMNLRDYLVEGQIGRESSSEVYLQKLWDVFDEAYRVLKDTGTCWVNIGDTFSGTASGQLYQDCDNGNKWSSADTSRFTRKTRTKEVPDKCLMMIPERFAWGMVRRGWILRMKIIWQKPNGMIEPSKDRTKLDYEMLYCFSKRGRYWFNYVEAKKPLKSATIKRNEYAVGSIVPLDVGASTRHSATKKKFGGPIGGIRAVGNNGNAAYSGNTWEVPHDGMAKIGSVWVIAPKSFGHEYCETCDELRTSRTLLFRCIDNKKTGQKGCGHIYRRLSPAEVLKANKLDPEQPCPVCNRSLKRHLTLNGKGRLAGLQPEVIDCGYFDLPKLQVRGCPECGNAAREPICPVCKVKVHMHFAMFPEELVLPALRMACPDQVCAKCGTPRFPIYTPTKEYAKLLGQGWHDHSDDDQQGQQQDKDVPKAYADYRISGWTECKCKVPKAEKYRPGVILDPFSGFNTTGAVAMKNGRNFVSIDLDIKNVKAGQKRVEKLLGYQKF